MRYLSRQTGFLVSCLIAGITLSPVLFILISGMNSEPEIWNHLKSFVLPELIVNTLILVAGVVGLTAFLGISLAWLTALHEFPGRKFFEKVLLLPLAIPTYVMAFIYIGLFDFSGPVQGFIRLHLPGLAPYFPEIRSAWGVILVISLAIFPYVLLMTSTGFKSMGQTVVEAALSLQAGKFSTLIRILIPMARPWIFGGLVLVFMETLADFGAVSVFNYDTFTTGVYKAWHGFFSINAASGLASVLVVVVLVLFLAESHLRKKQKFFNKGSQNPIKRTLLKGFPSLAAVGFCFLILFLSFLIPLGQLGVWTLSSFSIEFSTHYGSLVYNTLGLGTMGMVFTMVMALVLTYCTRMNQDTKTFAVAKLSLAGYALPGTVLAVGMINILSVVDRTALQGLELLGISLSSPLFQGSLLMLPLCYMVRFITAGYNPLYANFTRITPSMDESARLLKVTGFKLFTRIHFPLIKPGLVTGSILVLVEIIKEMPVTLMLRPFGWDTLAIKIFELTSEGEWERAALPALTLVIAGIAPIIILARMGKGKSNVSDS